MSKDEIKTKVRAILARTLKVDPAAIVEEASQANLSQWDSVQHMNVVLGVENEFEIEFEDVELPNLTTFPLLVDAVAKHTGA